MDSAYFDELIQINQDAISSFQRWWRVLLVSGVIFLLLSLGAWCLAVAKKIDSNLAPSLVTIFGIITSAASLLPYKEITPRRLAVAKYKQLKKEAEKIKKLPKEKQQKRLKDMSDLLKDL